MTLEYRCSNCGTLLQTTNADPLDAEIARLRAALMELQRLGEQGMKPDYGNWLTFHDKVAEVARTALEQKAAKETD